MRTVLYILLAGIALFSVDAAAHEPQSSAPDALQGVAVNLGAGVGAPHGIGGGFGEIEVRSASGLGISAHASAGPTGAVGGHVWTPGQRVRFGLGASVGASWSKVVGVAQPASGCSGPPDERQDGSGVFHVGGDLALDHDIGARGAWGLRYGIGASLVAAGCAGGVLPLPTLALYYRM
jgi:hypothetical protein